FTESLPDDDVARLGPSSHTSQRPRRPSGPMARRRTRWRAHTSIVIEVSVLAAAADPVRWRLLAELAAVGTRCACDLQPIAGVAPSVLSYQLKGLREAGLVTSQRRGRWIDYSLTDHAGERLANSLPTARLAPVPGGRAL